MLQQFNEKNRDLLININGELTHRDRAGISPFDSAVQGGDAVWEGLRVYDGRVFKLDEHLDRLRASAVVLGFAQIPSAGEITEQITRTLEANNMHDGVHIRLTLTRGVKITSGMDPRLNQSGPTLIVLAEHKAPVYADAAGGGGVALATSSIRRFGPDTLDPKIHSANLIQSIMAKIEATSSGADDSLMLDQRGFVAETNATHVFLVTDGVVETSRLVACPEGITRATVLELCAKHGIKHAERDLSLAEVYRADECFTTGTMGELAWVSRVDGRVIGRMSGRVADGTEPEIGPMTRLLAGLFSELTTLSGVRVVGA